MNKKIISIIGVIIAVLVLACTAFAAVSSVKGTRKLSGKIDEIQHRQEGFSSELQRIAENISQKKDKPEEPSNGTNADETKDWKVYKNENLGFEIKYPKECVALQQSKYKDAEFVEIGDNAVNYINIKVENNLQRKSAKQLIEENLKNHFGDLAYNTYKISTITISSKTGSRISFQDDSADIKENLIMDYIESNGRAYFIFVSRPWSSHSLSQFQDLVISSFKILQ